MKTAAVYNNKGGVGKTAAAVNVSFLAARSGLRTLVWDLDPQGAATFYFRVKPKVRGGGKSLVKTGLLSDRIKGTDYENLDLMPADFSYRNLDIRLEHAKKPEERLRKLLKPLRPEYDLVILDCPPSISIVGEAVLRASDALVVPVIPTTLSLRTLEQLLDFCKRRDFGRLNLMVFFSMVDRRKKLHEELMRTIGRMHPGVLRAFIPCATQVERMGVFRDPVACFAPSCAAAQAYEDLWSEIKTRMWE